MDKKKLIGHAIIGTWLVGMHALSVAAGVELCKHKYSIKYKDKTLIKFY